MSATLPFDPLTTARLALPLWTAADVEAIRSGGRREEWDADFPREDDVDAASLWRDGDPWGPRSIIAFVRRPPLVVGSIGCFGPPEPHPRDGVLETEVGYGLVPDARGRGLASEALGALLEATDAIGVRLRASVIPDNQASLKVLATCGFTDLRGTSEDGELVLARPLR
jgi:[ribosomal protein S5]-alanine N-acetyltransferase